jgi:hypothetical protein
MGGLLHDCRLQVCVGLGLQAVKRQQGAGNVSRNVVFRTRCKNDGGGLKQSARVDGVRRLRKKRRGKGDAHGWVQCLWRCNAPTAKHQDFYTLYTLHSLRCPIYISFSATPVALNHDQSPLSNRLHPLIDISACSLTRGLIRSGWYCICELYRPPLRLVCFGMKQGLLHLIGPLE